MKRPSVYPMTRSLRDFLRDFLLPVEQTVFEMFNDVRHLVHMVNACEQGQLPRPVVLAAIRQYNEDSEDVWSYDGILERTGPKRTILAPCGEWALHTDRPDLIMDRCGTDIDSAVLGAPEEVQWALFEVPSLGAVFVLRSPFQGYRQELDSEDALFCGGLYDGDVAAYVLPDELEIEIIEDNPPLVEHLFDMKEPA